MMFTDLFGLPIAQPEIIKPVRCRRNTSVAAKRTRFVQKLEDSGNLLLFPELLDALTKPILNGFLPTEFTEDISDIAVVNDDDVQDEESVESVSIPYEAWGEAWVTDGNGFQWSKESLLYLQVRLFWRSMEELVLNNNAQEKWSVLRWIFRPAIWKYFVYDRKMGQSRCLEVHERDEPFGFHNCCIASRMDEESVREGVRRNLPVNIINAVEAVCRFH